MLRRLLIALLLFGISSGIACKQNTRPEKYRLDPFGCRHYLDEDGRDIDEGCQHYLPEEERGLRKDSQGSYVAKVRENSSVSAKESGKYESSVKLKELLDKGTITNVDFIVLDALLSAGAEIKKETGKDPNGPSGEPSRGVIIRAGTKIAAIGNKYLDLRDKSKNDSNEYKTNDGVVAVALESGLSMFYMAKKNGIDLLEEYKNGPSELRFYVAIAAVAKQIPK